MIGCPILRRHREQAVAAMNAAMAESPRDERRAAAAIVCVGLALMARLPRNDERLAPCMRHLDEMRRLARGSD